jgi:hypothetical protein
MAKVQEGSFVLIACSQRYQRLSDALSAPEDCGPYDERQHYYERTDSGKIFLPVPPQDQGYRPLAPEEKSKVLNHLLQAVGSNLSVYYDQVNNGAYLRSYAAYDFSKELSSYDLRAAANAFRVSVRDEGRNPFQRAYLRLAPPVSGRSGIRPDTRLKIQDLPVQRRTNADSQVKAAAAAKAAQADRARLAKANKMLSAGDLEGARVLYQGLQKSRDRSVAAEAAGKYKELLYRQSQQKAAADAAANQKREQEEKQRLSDSIQRAGMQRNKRPSGQQQQQQQQKQQAVPDSNDYKDTPRK